MPEFRLLLYSYESFAKIAQASAMRVYSQIAERSFIFCKDRQLNRYCQTFLHLKTFSSFFPPFYTSKTSCRFALLLPVSQWVYDKSRIPLTTQAAEPTGFIRAIRDIRVPLTIQAAEPTGFIRAIRVPLTYTSSRDNRPYSCDSRYSCSLNHSSSRVPRT